jgi:hypothetical protein
MRAVVVHDARQASAIAAGLAKRWLEFSNEMKK